MKEHDDWNWKIIYKSLINDKELLSLQKHFCSASGLCAYCVDAYGNPRTDITGNTEDITLIRKHISDEQIADALERVKEGSIEELVVENADAVNLRYAVLSVRVNGRVMVNWVLFGFLEDVSEEGPVISGYHNSLSEMSFYRDVDLLMVSTKLLFESKWNAKESQEQNLQQDSAYNESNAHTMSSLIALLDSDDTVEAIMVSFLKILIEEFHFTGGYIYHVDADSHTVDLLAQYHTKGNASPYDKTRGLLADEMLFTKEPVFMDSESIRKSRAAACWYENGVRAFLLYPLESNMCVSLCQFYEERVFTRTELHFLHDAMKILQSILSRRIQNNSLSCSYASLESVLDSFQCCIYIKDRENGKVLFVNKQLQTSFPKELADGSFEKLLEKKAPFLYEVPSRTSDDATRSIWYDMSRADIVWVDGRKVNLYALYDITDRKAYQKKAEQQTYTDSLTGLYNRMCCERDLAVYVDDAERNGQPGALLYLDLDDFKHINDGLGHRYGDELLKKVSVALTNVPMTGKHCYRVGGDEFIVIVPPAVYDELSGILTSIQDIFKRPWRLKGMDYYCTMSMGVVEFPQSGKGVQDLIKKADIAMYEAKKKGKNRVEKYLDGLDSESGRRLTMEKNMRDATVAGCEEFEIYYQPITDISLPGTPCTGAEALLRWNSASLGFISPADFIPLAEYLGLINPIGYHVLVEACRECRRWNENGHPEYKVNVNLSVVQLMQPDIVESVEKALRETGLTPHNLTLEVTESLAINDMNRMKEILGDIRKLGVRIALDDFGTGYSSLNHIRELPFDVIKVDQSFVKDLAEDAYSQSFIKMVAELAQTIGVSICVEGIETEEQYRLLEDMKVRMVQGYYFARPMKKCDFEAKYVQDCHDKRIERNDEQNTGKVLPFPEKHT